MPNLSEFFNETPTLNNIDLTNPSLTYSDWKTISDIGSSSHFKHPITGNTRIKKFQKNAWEKYVKSLQSKIETEEFIKEILKDKTLPMKQCNDCKKWYPAIQEYNGKTVSFWVTNRSAKDGFRNFCGKWGTRHEYESYGVSVLTLGCDTERDRQKYITKDNPTGIRRGGESDHSDRMKYPHKILERLVSSVKTADKRKGLVCDLPEDWAIKKAEEQDGCCAKTGEPFDYTHLTYKEGKNIFKPSINRIDNTKPHTIDNCELILRFLNLGFGNAPKHLVDKITTIFRF